MFEKRVKYNVGFNEAIILELATAFLQNDTLSGHSCS